MLNATATYLLVLVVSVLYYFSMDDRFLGETEVSLKEMGEFL